MQDADIARVKVTRAQFEAAYLNSSLDDAARRERRAKQRGGLMPPGMIRPRWMVSECIRYHAGEFGSAEFYDVDAGFEFDGASAPWPLTLLVPKTHSLYLGAAALHDWLYAREYKTVSRARADELFREAMLVLGQNWFWAMVMWRAVRAGGWMSWYARVPHPVVTPFLKLPLFIRAVFGNAASLVAGVVGLVVLDLPRFGFFRQEARRIAATDIG